MSTVVPFTPYEWARVKSMFKSRQESDVEEVVSIMRMWTTRMGDTTPVAISCSHLLLQCVLVELKHEKMEEAQKWSTIDNLRSTHGHAICRFINYVNEIGQKSDYLLNMTTAVKKLGIPADIVEIRHAIAHQAMPGLDDLRRTTEFCLEWIWKEFWDNDVSVAMQSNRAGMQEISDEFDTNKKKLEEEITRVLFSYKLWRKKNPGVNFDDSIAFPKLMPIQNVLMSDPNSFLKVFLSDSFLIMTPSELKSAKIVTSDDEAFETFLSGRTFWQPVLTIIFGRNLGSDVVIALLWRLKTENLDKNVQNQITGYARAIIKQAADEDCKFFTNQEWLRILDHILSVATFFNKELINSIMQNIPTISRKRRQLVTKVLEISTEVEMTSDFVLDKNLDDSVCEVRTVDDLKELFKKERKKQAGGQSSCFELCDSEDWANVPFGMAPGQRRENFTLIYDIGKNETQNEIEEVASPSFPKKRRL